jgi:hypothetical protein
MIIAERDRCGRLLEVVLTVPHLETSTGQVGGDRRLEWYVQKMGAPFFDALDFYLKKNIHSHLPLFHKVSMESS